jgi:outer membrane lipoprotein-sorting protein
MFRSRALFFCIPVVIFLASCAWSSSAIARVAKILHAGQATNFTVEGKINSLDHNKLTLNTEGNIIFHVRYDDKTEFKRDDGSAASSKDLRVGLRIRVEGDLTESGEIVAQRIELQKAPPKK